MERLMAVIEEPAFFFLDAHFAGGDTAFGTEEVPLIRELDVLATRSQKDIIVIDDLRLLGKRGVSGAEEDTVYPKMTYDWRTVTIASIERAIGRDSSSLWKFRNDRLVIFRNLSAASGFLLHVSYALMQGVVLMRRAVQWVYGSVLDTSSS
tara:strand:- start:404 stop:856 length:453 start_codon:yes stop_codon:yes gene_type:complete